MKRLIIGSISGIYNQFYSENQTITGKSSYLENDYLDINSWFWSDCFDEEKILYNIKKVKNKNIEMPPHITWALYDTEHYIQKLNIAKKNIKFPIIDPQELYLYLEILQIACELIYYSQTYPFKLDVSSGFLRSCDSSKELYENCTLIHSNPYLEFIQKNIIPLICYKKPEILWLCGRPNIVSFTIAILVRESNPNIVIGIIEHSSEYYSINKIRDLLKQNHYFFKAFNLVVLDDGLYTASKVEKVFEENRELSTVNNIIYSLDKGKHIVATNTTPSEYDDLNHLYKSKKPINIKLFPSHHCYWNKCSFCGINNKYLFFNKEWDYTMAFKRLLSLNKQGIEQFWSIDEAIPANVLEKIADKIILEHWNFKWHIRTRIDSMLINEELCNKLRQAGLKSILLGFESASENVLYFMHKSLEIENYLEIAEKIVREFTTREIAVHFPAIIGFPTETIEDRERTFSFLLYLKDKYPLFSYNINIFELDISSKVYKNFALYNISTLCFPCQPNFFIGNSVDWGVHNRKELEEIQENFMKKFFVWFPDDSLLNIVKYYNLLEHTRIPFWNDKLFAKILKKSLSPQMDYLKINNNVSFWIDEENNFTLFNTDNLQYVKGGSFLATIFQLHSWTNCNDILKLLPNAFSNNLLVLLEKLVDYKILIRKE